MLALSSLQSSTFKSNWPSRYPQHWEGHQRVLCPGAFSFYLAKSPCLWPCPVQQERLCFFLVSFSFILLSHHQQYHLLTFQLPNASTSQPQQSTSYGSPRYWSMFLTITRPVALSSLQNHLCCSFSPSSLICKCSNTRQCQCSCSLVYSCQEHQHQFFSCHSLIIP